jgi:hypothetical protein
LVPKFLKIYKYCLCYHWFFDISEITETTGSLILIFSQKIKIGDFLILNFFKELESPKKNNCKTLVVTQQVQATAR